MITREQVQEWRDLLGSEARLDEDGVSESLLETVPDLLALAERWLAWREVPAQDQAEVEEALRLAQERFVSPLCRGIFDRALALLATDTGGRDDAT